MIESSSRMGETVVDPFAGVGSTGVAALLLGRKAVLVEQDERYVQIAAERLQTAERLWTEMGTV
jgi:DNA modification methylase